MNYKKRKTSNIYNTIDETVKKKYYRVKFYQIRREVKTMANATDLKVSNLKVLIVASEITPYAKSGGLGDVIGSLPQALKENGVDVRVIIPKYKNLKLEKHNEIVYKDSFVVTLGWRNQSASIHEIEGAKVPTYLIENDYYFGRDGLYGYGDDYERFAFFSKAAVECTNNLEFCPDIIHFNDWQTGLGSVYLKDMYRKFAFYKNIKTVYTIHNLQYQGVFGRDVLGSVDLNDGYYTGGLLEFYGNVSYMKAGLVYADAITTVSQTYADEIQTQQYGYGMDGLLRSFNYKLSGILNGIDTKLNDPETDERLFETFSANTLNKKKENKKALQKQLNLPEKDVPIISIISRLVDQKGLDLVAFCMEELVHKDIQLVVLGTGDGRYEQLFKHYAWREPEKVSANIYFSEDLAQKIYASSDIFLMPSLFEPCGLGQLFAMRYGTIPVVRRTGGLNDTVSHFNPETKEGNGFIFNDYIADGMMWALNQALDVYYNDTEAWTDLVKNAMKCDFSWDKSAEKYIELYQKLKSEK